MSGFRILLTVTGAIALTGIIGVLVWQATQPKTPATGDADTAFRREERTTNRPSGSAPVVANHAAVPLMGPGQTMGTVKPINYTPTPNASTELMVDALQTGTHTERLSSAVMPAAFDAQQWTSNPEYAKTYLATPEPGRIWQVKAPGEGVIFLKAVGEVERQAMRNQPITLEVIGVPLMPVTFTAVDGGTFSNQLATQTVATDAEGRAHVVFMTPDTNKHVMAASPMSAGQVGFRVTIANKD